MMKHDNETYSEIRRFEHEKESPKRKLLAKRKLLEKAACANKGFTQPLPRESCLRQSRRDSDKTPAGIF